jgi:ankyrin repeat protein
VTEQFVITALTGTKTQLRQWTDRHPGLLDELRQTHPALVQRAASRGRTDMIPALIDLGLDIDARSGGSGTTALHHAASTNDLELAKTLIGLGADPDITDAHVEATPLGWAEHSRNNEVADYLGAVTE